MADEIAPGERRQVVALAGGRRQAGRRDGMGPDERDGNDERGGQGEPQPEAAS